MARTIVKTTNPGWYLNAADPDGNRVRKQDGDEIISREEYEARKLGLADTNGHEAGGRTATQERAAHAAKAIPARREQRPQQTDKEKAVPTTISETGKILRGKITTIKCGWKDKPGAKACGRERTIKVQDQFQVKYCTEHQALHRRRTRSAKAKAKREAAKKAVKASA